MEVTFIVNVFVLGAQIIQQSLTLLLLISAVETILFQEHLHLRVNRVSLC